MLNAVRAKLLRDADPSTGASSGRRAPRALPRVFSKGAFWFAQRAKSRNDYPRPGLAGLKMVRKTGPAAGPRGEVVDLHGMIPR